jgi:outer membrane protein assembly factor BamB
VTRTAIVAALLLAATARAEDWPQFRGPTGQGLSTEKNLPLEWGPDKNAVWQTPISGHGWSSPILHAGRIYLTSAVPSGGDQSLKAFCLDAKSGSILWDKEVFLQKKSSPKIHKKNSYASPTPITDGQRLYVHFGHEGTAALDLEGTILWRNTDLRYSPVHGNGGTPALVGDALIFSSDGGDKQFIVALDKTNGKPVWKTDRKTTYVKKFAFSTPLAITAGKTPQIVSPGAGLVGGYDLKSGKEIWRVAYDGYSVIPRPVFGHGLVFVSSSYDSPVFYAIRPDGKGDVTKTHVVWSIRKGAPHTPSPLLVGDEIYLVSDGGLASCLDAKKGTVHWQERISNAFSASPLYADGHVYFQSEDGVGTVVKASKKFEKVARNEMNEKTLASYAVGDGAIFLRTETKLYRIQTP